MFRQFGVQELLVILLLVLPVILLIVLVVALVRRSSRRRENSAPTPQGRVVPGWYADPQDSARLRYWDGNSWTDRTARQESG